VAKIGIFLVVSLYVLGLIRNYVSQENDLKILLSNTHWDLKYKNSWSNGQLFLCLQEEREAVR